MVYNQYSNNQQKKQADNEFPVGICIKKAMTRPRGDLYGNGQNRGILIEHPQTKQERWVSIPLDNRDVIEAQTGCHLYYHGHGNRPSLTLPSLGEQIQNGQYQQPQQQPIDYNQPYYGEPAQANPVTDDCDLMAGIYSTLASYLPNVDEEQLTKMAISIYIQQSK